MPTTIPVINWQQSGFDTLYANYVCDVSIDTSFNFLLYGTDPSGGGNSESEVKAVVVVVDNFNNNSTATISFAGATYTIAPYARKSFPISNNQRSLTLRVSLGQVKLTFANYNIGIPDDVNQYALSSGQLISTTTFDPFHTGVGITLSNGNLTAASGNGVFATSLANVAKGTGKLYVEFTATLTGPGSNFGLATDLFDTSLQIINTNGAAATYAGSLNSINVNAVTVGSTGFPPMSNGDTAKMAVNLTSKLIWFAKIGSNWNNDPTFDPATGVGGISIAAITFPVRAAMSTQNTTTMTANFGGSPFLNPVPAGFTGWY